MSAVKPILRAVKLGTKQIDEVATAAAVSRAPVTRGLAADAAEELRRIEADEAAELGYTQQQMDELDADVMDAGHKEPRVERRAINDSRRVPMAYAEPVR
jgi:hypothetical protein